MNFSPNRIQHSRSNNIKCYPIQYMYAPGIVPFQANLQFNSHSFDSISSIQLPIHNSTPIHAKSGESFQFKNFNSNALVCINRELELWIYLKCIEVNTIYVCINRELELWIYLKCIEVNTIYVCINRELELWIYLKCIEVNTMYK